MFTGLIKEMGTVAALERTADGAKLVVVAPRLGPRAAPGDSIAADGACLTMTMREGDRLSFDVSGETLARTTMGGLRPGDRVNLEDALTPSSPMGGHFVLGHVDGVGAIVSRRPAGKTAIITFRVPQELSRYLVPKGSVAVDGISLTVNEARGDTFTATLIPRTLESVTLGGKRVGDQVNIETDILVKSVDCLLGTTGRGGHS